MIRTSRLICPKAIANNLPYNLAASFEMWAQNSLALTTSGRPQDSESRNGPESRTLRR